MYTSGTHTHRRTGRSAENRMHGVVVDFTACQPFQSVCSMSKFMYTAGRRSHAGSVRITSNADPSGRLQYTRRPTSGGAIATRHITAFRPSVSLNTFDIGEVSHGSFTCRIDSQHDSHTSKLHPGHDHAAHPPSVMPAWHTSQVNRSTREVFRLKVCS